MVSCEKGDEALSFAAFNEWSWQELILSFKSNLRGHDSIFLAKVSFSASTQSWGAPVMLAPHLQELIAGWLECPFTRSLIWFIANEWPLHSPDQPSTCKAWEVLWHLLAFGCQQGGGRGTWLFFSFNTVHEPWAFSTLSFLSFNLD